MASSMRLWLVLAAFLAGSLLAACDDGDDKGDENGAADQPTATQVVDGEDTDGADDGDDEGDGGEAFEDIPLPEGADETETITMSGSELPFLIPPGADIDAESYGQVTMKMYEVDGSPDEVLDFFKDNRGGWEEVFGVSADDGGLLVWIRDDGARVAWIVTAEGSESGTTDLTIAEGRLEE